MTFCNYAPCAVDQLCINLIKNQNRNVKFYDLLNIHHGANYLIYINKGKIQTPLANLPFLTTLIILCLPDAKKLCFDIGHINFKYNKTKIYIDHTNANQPDQSVKVRFDYYDNNYELIKIKNLKQYFESKCYSDTHAEKDLKFFNFFNANMSDDSDSSDIKEICLLCKKPTSRNLGVCRSCILANVNKCKTCDLPSPFNRTRCYTCTPNSSQGLIDDEFDFRHHVHRYTRAHKLQQMSKQLPGGIRLDKNGFSKSDDKFINKERQRIKNKRNAKNSKKTNYKYQAAIKNSQQKPTSSKVPLSKLNIIPNCSVHENRHTAECIECLNCDPTLLETMHEHVAKNANVSLVAKNSVFNQFKPKTYRVVDNSKTKRMRPKQQQPYVESLSSDDDEDVDNTIQTQNTQPPNDGKPPLNGGGSGKPPNNDDSSDDAIPMPMGNFPDDNVLGFYNRYPLSFEVTTEKILVSPPAAQYINKLFGLNDSYATSNVRFTFVEHLPNITNLKQLRPIADIKFTSLINNLRTAVFQVERFNINESHIFPLKAINNRSLFKANFKNPDNVSTEIVVSLELVSAFLDYKAVSYSKTDSEVYSKMEAIKNSIISSFTIDRTTLLTLDDVVANSMNYAYCFHLYRTRKLSPFCIGPSATNLEHTNSDTALTIKNCLITAGTLIALPCVYYALSRMTTNTITSRTSTVSRLALTSSMPLTQPQIATVHYPSFTPSINVSLPRFQCPTFNSSGDSANLLKMTVLNVLARSQWMLTCLLKIGLPTVIIIRLAARLNLKTFMKLFVMTCTIYALLKSNVSLKTKLTLNTNPQEALCHALTSSKFLLALSLNRLKKLYTKMNPSLNMSQLKTDLIILIGYFLVRLRRTFTQVTTQLSNRTLSNAQCRWWNSSYTTTLSPIILRLSTFLSTLSRSFPLNRN